MAEEEFFQGNLEVRKALSNALETHKPVLIGRISIGGEASICDDFTRKQFPQLHIHQLINNAGILVKSVDDIRDYVLAALRAFQHSTLIGIWTDRRDWSPQEFIVKAAKRPTIAAQALEPFYFLERGPGNNWMEPLKGQSVLVISPFADTFQRQIDSGNFAKAFAPGWFEGTTFSFIKPPVTLAGNHGNRTWQLHFKEFQAKLRQHIGAMDSKPAACLVSCGGYGMPVCDFLFTEMGLSAIYVGGALQLFFGVLGQRWTENSTIQKYVAANPDAWTRPSEEERPPNLQQVERGCYW
jgi:hypothetical protein